MFTQMIQLPLKSLFILVRQVEVSETHKDSAGSDYSADFLIKVRSNIHNYRKNNEYFTQNDFKIDYTNQA